MKHNRHFLGQQAMLGVVLLAAAASSQAASGQDACDQALIAAQGQLDQASAAGATPSPDRRSNLDAVVNAAVDARRACTGVQSAPDAPPATSTPTDKTSSSSMADKVFKPQPEPSSNAERRARQRARSPKAG